MAVVIKRTLSERVAHALMFEVIAISICAPALAWIMGKSLTQMGILTLMFATVAMLWNMLFNFIFDRAQARLGFTRTLSVRIIHALLFEGGLILALVPLAAWWLSVSLLEAFWLEIGLILFFLPYTVAFNWVYDVLRERLVERLLGSSRA